ncbi:hypothetical protein [Ornithinibacillus halophilus]|uniref:Uncharacterized protein n=1 Tax=Ornithinibacillus halophilus TaxID=930117 RepID=A0A1M5C179_9BACI|nr:hypothetical protein [Ornithinibacillus halophilus]SHF48367.1 hypothetical protein SAMN05216225_10017 [Ornithinibacillus halophilus]
MRFVMETLKRDEKLELLPVIKMEIDYELLTLHDAMEENDTVLIIKTKERLKLLRKKLLEITDEKD